jgi:tetratricopeptide (TPR) repeat protein
MRILTKVFFLSVIFNSFASPESISLLPAKEDRAFNAEGIHNLRESFLKQLASIFEVDAFIETGTYRGDTALMAARYFKQVYTIELSQELYNFSRNRFSSCPNIEACCGDSSCLLAALVNSVAGSKLFWLDAHNSGGVTVRGEIETPIFKELESIAPVAENSIVLIDDIRCFSSVQLFPDYPSIKTVIEKLKQINSGYQIVIYGDILMAIPSNWQIEIDPLIVACTESYLCDEGLVTAKRALACESYIISHGRKNPTFEHLVRVFKTAHYHLWYGLVLSGNRCYEQALYHFAQAERKNLAHWRVNWYKALCLAELGRLAEAFYELNRVLKAYPQAGTIQQLYHHLYGDA